MLRRACFASSLWQLTCLLLSLSLGARTCKQPTNASLRRVASFAAACCRCRVLTCLLHFAGSAVCEPQRLQAHRKLQDASAAASAASGAASGAAAAGASSESTSAAAAAAAAATGEASLLYTSCLNLNLCAAYSQLRRTGLLAACFAYRLLVPIWLRSVLSVHAHNCKGHVF